jgi:hypothetical protein
MDADSTGMVRLADQHAPAQLSLKQPTREGAESEGYEWPPE